jgi:lipoprotein-anchoring transpeptidase ErfK/SrfK
VRTPQRLFVSALLVLSPLVAACGGGGGDSAQTTAPPADSGASATTEAPGGDSATTSTHHYTSAEAKDTVKPNVQVYSAPDTAKKAQTLANPRLINDDPNAKVPLVMLVTEKQGDWLKVSLPVRPNGSTGWVQAKDFNTIEHDYRIEVNLSGFKIAAYKGDEKLLDTAIGLGTDENPTPGGTYYTTELIAPPNPDGDYGPYAFGLSGHSEKLTTFNGGPGQLGIHGTNEPTAIGKKISHGCIRLKNDDIKALVDLGMPLGTPVIINA